MKKKFLKTYGKIIAAAVFLTVAGFCYGCSGDWDGLVSQLETRTVETEAYAQPTEQDEKQSESEAVAESEQTSMCFVHICGEVKTPGVYELPAGSRIFEAVSAAGGLTESAAEASLNLAEVISDGMQIVILSKEEAAQAQLASEAAAAGLININTASKEQLMTLPGIGESRAEDIIRYREESGGFQCIEDIMKVSGIKDAAFQKIKDSIVV